MNRFVNDGTALWYNENTRGLHVSVHCSMDGMGRVFLFLYFYQLSRYCRTDIFPILLLNYR